LVTLTGPGGVGKTRLALQVASDCVESFADGVLIVPLEAIRDPELVLPAIAQSAGLVALSGQTPMAGLMTLLGQRDFLLVLDNFEQVIVAARDLAILLAHCPHLKILVSSRESLRIDGEHEFPVPPMSLPDRSASASDLTGSEAAQLFMQRARAVKPGFEATAETATTIADICIRLDGLPLAIELAASRVKILSPQAILARLVDRLTLLSRDGRDVPDRLRTMRDAVGWSYDLLTDEERVFFRKLSVFAGGCSVETAERVLQIMDGKSDTLLFEGLASLVDKSLLVQIDQPSGEPRFRMLDTVRDYGLEQLEAHGEAANARVSLANWLLETTRPAFDEQFGPRQRYWSDVLDTEHGNFRAALEWAINRGDGETAARLVIIASRYWHLRGNFAEASSWSDRTLAMDLSRLDPYVKARLLGTGGWLHYYAGDHRKAFALAEEGMAVARLANDQVWIAQSCHVLGVFVEDQGRFEDAKSYFRQALSIYRDVGDSNWTAFALNSLGHTDYESGVIDNAAAYFEEALVEFQRSGNTFGAGMVLTNLAKIARTRGDYQRAGELFRESLVFRWELGDKLGLDGCLRGLASVCMLTGKFDKAAHLYGAAEGLRESIGALPRARSARYDQSVKRLRTGLGEEAFRKLWDSGRNTPLLETVTDALSGQTWRSNHRDSASRSRNPLELTPRELEVLALIRAGRSNKEIGVALFVTERTAQTHVQHILNKLNVSTRAAAAAYAVEHELA
jgi:non-specific serine/threonine protein kinase